MHLPGPLRAAVGLVATAAAEAKHLPDRAIELPMLAVSSALQASLRAQQRYARLAARGDQVLNRRAPTAEPPPWATFDDPVPVNELRRAIGAPDAPAAGRSMFDQLFAVEDPAASIDGREPVDEVPTSDEAPIDAAADRASPAAAPQAAPQAPQAAPHAPPARKATARKAAASKAAAKKAPSKKAPSKKAPSKKAPSKKNAAKKVAATTAPAQTTVVNKPRHTAPSAFDNVGDD